MDVAQAADAAQMPSLSTILGWAAATIMGLFNVVMLLGKSNYGMAQGALREGIAANSTAITGEQNERRSDVRELRAELRAMADKAQTEREDKMQLRNSVTAVEGAVKAVQGSVDEQADALEKQTATLMSKLETLDYRKASRGEMAAAADSRRELEPLPRMGGRMPTGRHDR